MGETDRLLERRLGEVRMFFEYDREPGFIDLQEMPGFVSAGLDEIIECSDERLQLSIHREKPLREAICGNPAILLKQPCGPAVLLNAHLTRRYQITNLFSRPKLQLRLI